MKTTLFIACAGFGIALTGLASFFGFGPLHREVASDAKRSYDPQEITAEDSADDDQFGFSVALDGNTALIGVPCPIARARAPVQRICLSAMMET